MPDGQEGFQESIGYDANKRVKGRKRHIGVDTLGLLWVVIITSARVQDRDGALLMLRFIQYLEATLKVVFADSAYRGALEKLVQFMTEFELVIVDKPADHKGFVVQPKRWIVERTFAWICKYRRLVRDYEYLTEVSAANLYWAMTHRMLNWLTRAEQAAA